jgi:hypothetical protein
MACKEYSMLTVRAVVILLLATLLQSAVAAQPEAPDELEVLGEVLVVGRQPGPPLWKISSGDNVLWILPLVDFYPSKMQWESARVEALIAGSQEYLQRPTASQGFTLASFNPLSLSRTLGLYNDMTSLPRGTKLKDVLPSDTYQRFRAIKSRYFPRHQKIETMSLLSVQGAMQEEILKKEKLESTRAVMQKVGAWLRANTAMRRTSSGQSTMHAATTGELKSLRKLVDAAQRSDTFNAHQVACFEKVMEYFESNLEPAKRRAIAWAQGRAENLVSPTRSYPECEEAWAALQESPAGTKLVDKHPKFAATLFADREAMMADSREKWLAAAERALAGNASTFGVLMVNEMLGPEGLVTRLQEKGYKVQISAE